MCKCEQKTDFKVALRSALAETTETQKMAVWENKENKEVYYGTEQDAKSRLKNGDIECYFVPKKSNNTIGFDIVDTVEIEPKTLESKGESVNTKETNGASNKTDKKTSGK